MLKNFAGEALHTLKKDFVPPRDLAEQACHIELQLLNDPNGKQDQYISARSSATE